MSAPAVTGQISNAQARQLLLASALRRVQPVQGNQAAALGSTVSFSLPHAGICTHLYLDVCLPLTLGTADAIPNVKAPYSLISNVNLVDQNGTSRINCSAWGLYLLSLSTRRGFEPSSIYPYVAGGPQAADPYAAGFTFPQNIQGQYTSKAALGGAATGPSIAGDGVAAAHVTNVPIDYDNNSGHMNLNFGLWVPVAYNGWHDIRGGLLQTVPSGNSVLTLTLASALTGSGADTLYTGANSATAVLNSPTTAAITCYYYYLDPIPVPGVPTGQFPNGIPIPWQDLSLINEIKSLTDASGLSASATKQVVLGAGRDYYKCIGSIVENGAMNSSHLAKARFLYDGQTILTNESVASHYARLLYALGRMPPEGTLPYFDFSERPFDANSYGSLAFEVDTNSSFTNTSPTYIEVITQALYSTAMSSS